MLKNKCIVITDWREMLKELKKIGYTVSDISQIIGVSRVTLHRWMSGESEYPNYVVFSRMLYFYSYCKCRSPCGGRVQWVL